ncbi:hypothetical protein HanPI659440_Chr14g0570541 [Helianthus annuus]|nr:hypothetical protein HanPI659440_Chr14g0570541 [Helianthus annuus]
MSITHDLRLLVPYLHPLCLILTPILRGAYVTNHPLREDHHHTA